MIAMPFGPPATKGVTFRLIMRVSRKKDAPILAIRRVIRVDF